MMRKLTRRSTSMTVLAFAAGLLMASASAWGYCQLNSWRVQGDQFQLGYVVGYLDGVEIGKSRDSRSAIPSRGRPQYERWRQAVNEYFADPANAMRSVPDAMKWFGDQVQKEQLQAIEQRRLERAKARANASPAPSPGAQATP